MKWQTIGFNKNKNLFEDISANKRLGHSYLFWGEDMIGKRTFAMDLCSMMNEEEHYSGLDSLIIAPKISEGETKIYIEDIRDLKSFLSLKPLFGKYRIAIIDDADRLTLEATNAILKILEEPPSSGLLVLISSKPKALPKTIYSRCHHIHFANHEEVIMKEYLAKERVSSDNSEFLCRLSRGRIGWLARVISEDRIARVKKDIIDFEESIKSGVFEKMIYAKKLTERDDCIDVINNLIYYFSTDTDLIVKNKNVLRQLIKTYKIISQPQYNRRLMLENFVLSL